MRALFLLLLLANLLFLAWASWIAPSSPLAGAPTPTAADNRSIRLLREAPLAGATEPETGTSAARPADRPGATCVSAGPFLEKVQADVAAARLQNLGFRSRLRSAQEEVVVGKWVRVTNLATTEDAANALAALKAAGLTDAYVLSDTAPGSTISLGVFGGPAGAAEAVEKARKAGFAAEVTDRKRPADVWWLDIDRQENGSLPNLDSLGGSRPAEPPLELRACPATVAPPG